MNMRVLVFLALAAATTFAQRHKLEADNATPEGQTLQAIDQQTDDANKAGLIDAYLEKYPSGSGVAWACEQLQEIRLKQGQYDKAIAAGEKLLAADPHDMDAAYQNLKAAEGKKDPELVLIWAAKTSDLAREAAAKPPADDDAKQAVDRAKQVDTYTEYADYAAALGSTKPATTIALVESIEKRNPKSEYLSKAWGPYLRAEQQLGDPAKAGHAAETILEHDADNDEALLVAADYNLRVARKPDKVIEYSSHLTEVLSKKPKPDGITDADWEKRKGQMLGVAYWMSGISYVGEGKFAQGDKSLRAALPYIQSNKDLMATGLFHLGLADYKLSKGNKAMLRDALKYSEQSAALPGPMQAQAQTNATAIRRELGR
jgi:tetratricopeptide (TPR) repeat protein